MELTQRYWVLELIAFWEGQVNTKTLVKAFDISRQSASGIINKYLEAHANALAYLPARKAYQVTPSFRPNYIDKTVDEYFDWLTFGKAPTFYEPLSLIPQHRIKGLSRFVKPEVMRALLEAVRNNTAVDCEYLSVSTNASQGRLIYPHSFVKAANRWHVRAYCELRQDFLDFVLSRFQSVDYDGGQAVFTIENDKRWNTYVDLILEPDPRLTEKQKKVLERDYGMENGRLIVKTRVALVKYTLDDLQIKTKMLEADPQAQQLVCVNYKDIKQWLYE